MAQFTKLIVPYDYLIGLLTACNDYTIFLRKIKIINFKLFVLSIDYTFSWTFLQHSLDVPNIDVSSFTNSSE